MLAFELSGLSAHLFPLCLNNYCLVWRMGFGLWHSNGVARWRSDFTSTQHIYSDNRNTTPKGHFAHIRLLDLCRWAIMHVDVACWTHWTQSIDLKYYIPTSPNTFLRKVIKLSNWLLIIANSRFNNWIWIHGWDMKWDFRVHQTHIWNLFWNLCNVSGIRRNAVGTP